MTNETETGGRRIFVPAVLPWLLGGGMLVLYVLTRYHSPSPASLGRLAFIGQWNWRTEVSTPLTYLATYPLRWLPAHLQLAALNLLAAACAGAVLVLLARSVALLPHDRTNEQRLRVADGNGLLTTPTAWLPPLFAVLVCGLQITFWERSVQFVETSPLDSGEMLNLLVFAYVIRCLLEYRVSGRESWMSRGALAFGVGMANNCGMIGLFPLYLTAVIWIKGFDFFAWRFVVRMLLFGLAGLSLILLLPVIAGLQHPGEVGIWDSLKYVLVTDKYLLEALASYRRWFPVLAVTSFVPAALMGIRWATSFGDNSPLGILLANTAMNVAHGFLLACCLWVAMDPPFGPRQVIPVDPMLPVFYLGALSIGYFSGYFLLVFGSRPLKQRQRTPPMQKWFNRAVLAAVALLTIAAPVVLFANNLPRIRQAGQIAAASQRYYTTVERSLPQRTAVILSDSPEMMYNLESVQALQRDNRNDIFIDTSALGQSWYYISFLEAKHPRENIGGILTNRDLPGPMDFGALHLLESFSDRHDMFYLHPSFGYFFERFYLRPRGALYSLTKFPTNDWTPPPLGSAEIAENRAFWKSASNDVAALINILDQAESTPTNAWQQFQQSSFFIQESNRVAGDLAQLYSRALNYWGVQLQKAAPAEGEDGLREAADCFETAYRLNPENGPALVNRNFNRDLRQHKKPDVKLLSFEDKLPGTYRYWWEEVKVGGPFDQPGFCGRFGTLLRAGNNYRQAIEQFQRLEAFMPGDPGPGLVLAQTYLMAPSHEGDFAYAYPGAGASFFDAAAAADRALSIAPDDTNTLSVSSLCNFQLSLYLKANTNGNERPYPTAEQTFARGLAATDRLLAVTDNNPSVLSYKVEALMRTEHYEQAIPVATRLISMTNSPSYRLERGVAYFKSNKPDDARTDLQAAIKGNPDLGPAYYWLGELAYQTRNYPEALSNYEQFMTNAPAAVRQTDDYQHVLKRVSELKGTRQ